MMIIIVLHFFLQRKISQVGHILVTQASVWVDYTDLKIANRVRTSAKSSSSSRDHDDYLDSKHREHTL